MDPTNLLKLLQIFDSQFPVGTFVHSGGIETYAQEGIRADALGDLMKHQVLLGWGRGDLAAATLAWHRAGDPADSEGLARLGRQVEALKVVASLRETSVRLGRRTQTMLRRLYPVELDSLRLEPPHQAVVVGAAGRRLGIPLRELLMAFAQSNLTASLAAATRCLPFSPFQAQTLLIDLRPLLVAAVERAMAAPEDNLFSSTPAADIRSHQQAYLHTRLFQS